jgi:hypothetical protein
LDGAYHWAQGARVDDMETEGEVVHKTLM